jgi:hypothetical protein
MVAWNWLKHFDILIIWTFYKHAQLARVQTLCSESRTSLYGVLKSWALGKQMVPTLNEANEIFRRNIISRMKIWDEISCCTPQCSTKGKHVRARALQAICHLATKKRGVGRTQRSLSFLLKCLVSSLFSFLSHDTHQISWENNFFFFFFVGSLLHITIRMGCSWNKRPFTLGGQGRGGGGGLIQEHPTPWSLPYSLMIHLTMRWVP